MSLFGHFQYSVNFPYYSLHLFKLDKLRKSHSSTHYYQFPLPYVPTSLIFLSAPAYITYNIYLTKHVYPNLT